MKEIKKIKNWQVWIVIVSICLSFVAVNANENEAAERFPKWQTIGPSGGDVRTIVVDPKDKDRLYISTLDGQIYTSADAGESWELVVNLNRPRLILDDLMVDLRDSKIIYVSGHRHKNPGGFFKSIDGGRTWKEAKELSREAIHSMTQSPLDPNIITVGTTNGVWISKDSGDTGKKIESDTMPENVNSIAIDPRNTKTIYAGTWWRPYKTTDGGNTWRLIKNGMIDDSDIFAVTVDPRNPDHIFASACSGIYESFNGGERWAKIQGIPSQSRRTRDFLQHPSRPLTIYAGTTEGFWMSTNGGKSWAMTTQRDLEVNSITVHPDSPDRVFIGTNNYGVMVSNDGGKSFEQSNGNFSSRYTYSVTPDIERPTRLYATTINTATGGGFIFISDNSGLTWRPSVKGFDTNRTTAFSLVQDRVNPNTIYLATNFGFFQSDDRGTSWKQITLPEPPPVKKTPVRRGARGKTAPKPAPKPIPKPVETTPGLIPVIGDKINTLIHTEDGKNGYLAGTNNGLYRSYDIAKGWEKISFGENVNHQVVTILNSPYEPETIWIGTTTSGVLVSKDGGETWKQIPNSSIPTGIPISSIVVNPKNPKYIYVGTMQTFYLSKDGGKNWTRRGGNLPLGNYASILVNPNNGEEVMIASALEHSDGIFYSDDWGMNWKRIDTKDRKLASSRVWTLLFDPNNPNRILAGTHSSGIYRIEKTGATIKADNETPSDSTTRPRVAANGN
ncbi:MAG TPA: hypothetical protein VK892_23370 [Pyrinomonadaceae bacterium]|nr:hypothetical protein [Pyrinomonadaceae bacterium]